jgi:hypothetical protein
MTYAVNLAQGASNNVTFRNRLINGNMVIDQRNAGASVSVTTTNVYLLDRWKMWANGGGGTGANFTVQQSSTAPTGFSNSTSITVAGTSTVSGTVYNVFAQVIEGYNVADLNWGATAASAGQTAKPITLSFWVRSSLTGTFGGALNNSAQDRSYPFTYTINSANTWEQKSITVAGDTSGTWLTTNGIGLSIFWSLGTGSSYSGTAGAWAGTVYLSATGTTNLVGTNGATFYITGVQLEAGTTASPFEYRQYGTEVSLCQRYYEKSYNLDVVPGTSGAAGSTGMGGSNTGTTTGFLGASFVSYKVTKRVAGTITGWDNAGAVGKSSRYQLGVSGSNNQNWTLSSSGTQAFNVYSSGTSSDTGFTYSWSCDAEL